MKRYEKIALFCFLFVCLLSLIRYIDNIDSGLVEIISHFPFQYALISLVLMFFYVWGKNVTLAILAGLLFIFNMSAIIDFEDSIHAASQVETSFKVYSANIHKQNRELTKLTLEIQKVDPEIVFLMEVLPESNEQLRPLVQAYPYRIENVSDDILGFVFLSKFPVQNHHFTKLSEYGNSLLEARLEINQESIVFYGLHAQRQRFGNHKERINQFLLLARQIKEQSLPAIIAGDFNTTPYSPIFREIVNIAGLKDSRERFGWQPSWPTYFPPLWIPIDHILTTNDIQVRARTTGSYISSDHYPVIAELSLDLIKYY